MLFRYWTVEFGVFELTLYYYVGYFLYFVVGYLLVSFALLKMLTTGFGEKLNW